TKEEAGMNEVSTLQPCAEAAPTDLVLRIFVRKIGRDACAVVQTNSIGLVLQLRPQNSDLLEKNKILRCQPRGNDSGLHHYIERASLCEEFTIESVLFVPEL